jgi:hypothetical protein
MPGNGPNEGTLSAMRKQASKPDSLMGEAWFLADERRMFTELDQEIGSVPTRTLQEALGEIGCGVSSFGCLEEWEVWFNYLLPRIIPRCDEKFVSWLLEEVCTAFLQVDLGTEKNDGTTIYRYQALQTLGQSLMTSNRWHDGKIVLGSILHPSNRNPARIWGWANVSGDLAASLIVCLRLIDTKDIQEWVNSIFAIACPYWRAQLLTWYVGARPLLNEKVHFPRNFDEWTPQIGWSWSHVVHGNQGGSNVADRLFPEANIATFKAAFEANLREADLKIWQNEILEIEALRVEVGPLVKRFEID